MSFIEIFKRFSFDKVVKEIEKTNIKNIESTLEKLYNNRRINFIEYTYLLSKKADHYLEDLAKLSQIITRKRFGKTIQIFTPLYLSNSCRSSCLYCGFSFENKIKRKTLSFDEVEEEAKAISKKGIRHVLILTGEDYSKTSVEYIVDSVRILKRYFDSISVEIYPLKKEEYDYLVFAGVDGLILYQETYHKEVYEKVHIRGVKKNMKFRLEGPDRGGEAKFYKIGIGVLLGLTNPIGDLFFLGLHGEYLIKNYWQTSIQFSLPRLNSAEGKMISEFKITDRDYLRYISALRCFFQDSTITLSTRENQKFRDNLLNICINQISVESKTTPGGYALDHSNELEQFETHDNRSISEVIQVLQSQDLAPVFKDFERV